MKIFFMDLDGTIEDSRADMTWCAQQLRLQFGLPQWSDSEILPNVNKGMRELYTSCFSDLLIGSAKENAFEFCLAEIQLAYENIYLENAVRETKLYPNMQEVIGSLHKLGKVIVITNKPEAISKELLKQLNVSDLISNVVGGDSCAECKPSSLPLAFAFQKLGIPERDFDKMKTECFMIGDSAGDVKCGTEFGIRTIWCAYGYATSPGPIEPWKTAKTPLEILDHVTK